MASGFDSSLELLEIASELYPKIGFHQGFLPELKEIDCQYENILCETVIMHLPQEQLQFAIQSLKRILKPDGVLYLSWRVTEEDDARSADGRLYSAFSSEYILSQFDRQGVIFFEDKLSASSGKRVCRMVYRRVETTPS